MFSTYAVTDSTGAVAERNAYDPYGQVTTFDAGYADPQPTSRMGNPFTFTGRELDAESALMHYRARAYSPTHGRFLQRDPLEYGADDLNLFRYAHTNPIRFVDPSGLVSGSTKEYAIGGTSPITKHLDPGNGTGPNDKDSQRLRKEQSDFRKSYQALIDLHHQNNPNCKFEVIEHENTRKSFKSDMKLLADTMKKEFVGRLGKEGCNVFIYLGHTIFTNAEWRNAIDLRRIMQAHGNENRMKELVTHAEARAYADAKKQEGFVQCDLPPTFGAVMCRPKLAYDQARDNNFEILDNDIGERLLAGPQIPPWRKVNDQHAQNFLTYGAALMEQARKSALDKCKDKCCDIVRVHVIWGGHEW